MNRRKHIKQLKSELKEGIWIEFLDDNVMCPAYQYKVLEWSRDIVFLEHGSIVLGVIADFLPRFKIIGCKAPVIPNAKTELALEAKLTLSYEQIDELGLFDDKPIVEGVITSCNEDGTWVDHHYKM